MDPDLTESIEALEKNLSLKVGFFNDLDKEDDWSFVIKSQSLMEAAVSYVLMGHFNDDRLAPQIHAMQMAGKVGKIQFAKSLQLLPNEFMTFINKLSELRNSLIHKIENTSFSFKRYVEEMERNKLNEFVSWIRMGEDSEVKLPDGGFMPRQEFIAQNPRISIFMNMMIVLGYISEKGQLVRLRHELHEKEFQIAKLHSGLYEK